MKKLKYKNIIIIVCIFVLFLIISYVSVEGLVTIKSNPLDEYTMGFSDTSKIPNIIWAFWEGEPNKFVNKCIDSWKYYNPNYTVNILNKNNYSKYVDVDISKIKHSSDHLARYSVYVRSCILSKHGGIWIDASIICHSPFSWIHGVQKNRL